MYQWILCHTLGGQKLSKKLDLELLRPALMASDNSWWRYFFNLSDLIADRGQWYFQVFQSHNALWELWKPLELWVLALTSEKQPSCNRCLLHMILTVLVHFFCTRCSTLCRIRFTWMFWKCPVKCMLMSLPTWNRTDCRSSLCISNVHPRRQDPGTRSDTLSCLVEQYLMNDDVS